MKTEQEIRDFITFCDVQAGFCLERLILDQYPTRSGLTANADRESLIMYRERAEALRWVIGG